MRGHPNSNGRAASSDERRLVSASTAGVAPPTARIRTTVTAEATARVAAECARRPICGEAALLWWDAALPTRRLSAVVDDHHQKKNPRHHDKREQQGDLLREQWSQVEVSGLFRARQSTVWMEVLPSSCGGGRRGNMKRWPPDSRHYN